MPRNFYTVRLGTLVEIRPTVNLSNHHTVPSGQTWGPRRIPDCQLVYVVAGQLTLELGGEQFVIDEGHGAFYGERSPHRLIATSSSPMTFCSLHFSWYGQSPEPVSPVPLLQTTTAAELASPAVHYLLEIPGHGEMEFPRLFHYPLLEDQFLAITREYRNQEPGYEVAMRGQLTYLLSLIVRHQLAGGSASADSDKIAPALAAIQANPQNSWTTPNLAELCGYHPTYFAFVFRNVTGMTPKNYLMQQRVKRAKELLPTARSMDEVAAALGYSDIHYFSRNFKAMTGMTPSEYRRQSKEI
ncbi:MAG: AraC family transcriptional regulator [Paenibacillaceae bacterium]|nr:AraC family transcriptional regulator [Paenibacillaceae bacterium]